VAVSAVHDATWWYDMRECYYVPSFALVNASQLMGILLGFYCLSAPALMILNEGKCGLLSWFDFLWLEEGKKKTIYLFPRLRRHTIDRKPFGSARSLAAAVCLCD
jgi:hypothetical protein